MKKILSLVLMLSIAAPTFTISESICTELYKKLMQYLLDNEKRIEQMLEEARKVEEFVNLQPSDVQPLYMEESWKKIDEKYGDLMDQMNKSRQEFDENGCDQEIILIGKWLDKLDEKFARHKNDDKSN